MGNGDGPVGGTLLPFPLCDALFHGQLWEGLLLLPTSVSRTLHT